MSLIRLDHVGIVVAELAAHVAQLEALGLPLGRTSESSESHALYFPCGDASVELIDVRDPAARTRRLPAGERSRIEHIAFETDSDLGEAARPARGPRRGEASWPPFRSGAGEMIWTTADTSGGVQYQFWRRLPRGGER